MHLISSGKSTKVPLPMYDDDEVGGQKSIITTFGSASINIFMPKGWGFKGK